MRTKSSTEVVRFAPLNRKCLSRQTSSSRDVRARNNASSSSPLREKKRLQPPRKRVQLSAPREGLLEGVQGNPDPVVHALPLGGGEAPLEPSQVPASLAPGPLPSRVALTLARAGLRNDRKRRAREGRREGRSSEFPRLQDHAALVQVFCRVSKGRCWSRRCSRGDVPSTPWPRLRSLKNVAVVAAVRRKSKQQQQAYQQWQQEQQQ